MRCATRERGRVLSWRSQLIRKEHLNDRQDI
jgi:hypothetical protein